MRDLDMDGEATGIESTAALLARARVGDHTAREELAERYLTTLRRWAHGRVPRRVRGLVDTDDIVQSTLMRAFQRLDSFEPRREGAFLAYLRQILLNQIRDEGRRGGRMPEQSELPEHLPSPARSPIEETIGRESLARYEVALARLIESQREAVILRLELGLRYREVAEAMELPSASAARMLVARALVHLAEELEDHDEA